MKIVGSTLYLADQHFGIQIFDISTPGTAEFLGWSNTPGSAMHIEIAGSLAYVVADGEAGIQVVYAEQGCRPDCMRDGLLDIFDVHAYLSIFYGKLLEADLNFDGTLDVFDIFVLLNELNAGCR